MTFQRSIISGTHHTRWFQGVCVALLLLVAVSSQAAAAPSTDLVASCFTDGTWQLWRFHGGKAEQLTFTPVDKRTPAWSRDGRRILFRGHDDSVSWVEVETGKTHQVATDLPGIHTPAWDRAGNAVFLTSFARSRADDASLWRIPLGAGSPRRLEGGPGVPSMADVSGDGEWIVFAWKGRDVPSAIWKMKPDGTVRRALTRSPAGYDIFPRWSPDGKKIVFASDRSGNYEIWLMDAEGLEQKRLTDHPAYDSHPTWSPDGRQIAFTSLRDGGLRVWLIPSVGGEVRPVTPENMDCQEASWKP